MRSDVRRKLEMAERVSEFQRANPFPEGSASRVVAAFEERLSRARVLAGQQETGLVQARQATAERAKIREEVIAVMRQLAAVSVLAAEQDRTILGRFDLPRRNMTYMRLITRAKESLTAAVEQKELLLAYGMTEALFEELTASVAKLEGATSALIAARRSHIGARADLDAVTGDLVNHIRVLHGLNRSRFSKDPERLGAWTKIRQVLGPFRARRAVSGAPEGGESPGSGSLPTAA